MAKLPPTPDERAEEAQRKREDMRASHLEALANIVDPIHITTQNEIKITVETPQVGTILDTPKYPLMYSILVEGNVKVPQVQGWSMQGQFEECVCFLNGFQTALMMLAAMVGEPQGVVIPDA